MVTSQPKLKLKKATDQNGEDEAVLKILDPQPPFPGTGVDASSKTETSARAEKVRGAEEGTSIQTKRIQSQSSQSKPNQSTASCKKIENGDDGNRRAKQPISSIGGETSKKSSGEIKQEESQRRITKTEEEVQIKVK